MCSSAPRVCSEPGGQKPVLSMSLDRIITVQTLLWFITRDPLRPEGIVVPCVVCSSIRTCYPYTLFNGLDLVPLSKHKCWLYYDDVIMTTKASQITSLTVVYSIVYSGVDQRKHQNSASLAFVRGSHRDRWIPRTKGQLRGKCFHLMTSSLCCLFSFFLHMLPWDFWSTL